MKRQTAAALLLLLSVTARMTEAQQSEAKARARIEGVVTRAETGQPVAGARVTLLPLAPPRTARRDNDVAAVVLPSVSDEATSRVIIDRVSMPGEPPPLPSSSMPADAAILGKPSPIPFVTTDSTGKFAFKDLAPGNYRLWIEVNGYVGQEYGRAASVIEEKQFTLAEGQTLDGLTFTLTPTGSVAGRVHSTSGQPVVGVPVTLYKKTFNEFGRQQIESQVGMARTNDHGEYRIFWIAPGRYYLIAGHAFGDAGWTSPDSNEVADAYVPTFYPNVTDLEGASMVDVRPGAELEGLNFTIQPQGFGRIRGRVIDARTGQASEEASVSVISNRHQGRSFDSYYDPATGTFDIPRLPTGEYLVTAVLPEQSSNPPFTTTTVALTLTDAGIDNLLISVAAPDSIAGQIRADAPLPAAGLQVTLEPQNRPNPGSTPYARIAADGSFTLRAQRSTPIEYRVVVNQLPAGWYLKEARLGDVNALNPIPLSGAGKLEIMLSSRAGRVSGSVKDADGRPAPGAQVVLVPDTSRQRVDLFQTAFAQRDGSFAFSNVPPGDYKIYAWETIDFNGWFNPAALKEFESRATPVHVSEASRETLNLRVIPAEGEQ